MPKWLIVAEEMVQAEGNPPQRQVKAFPLPGNLDREKALVKLREKASQYKPDSFNGAPRAACRNGDDSFLIVSTNDKWHAPCVLRLHEQVA
ncbi:hypothetical protein J7F03_31295 [Streptomyces sp. ISL-43]|uniref:hypothetical protein n=1 Tax=Streptomyces sp. ISL-43 TaxID=2819183 RepID=UPI001BE8F16D|nr:hypothetical protein [Streptomyces sp. ISL-43]MBT2451471.1 hypothetical protein [Streptomyces sp. ISL-43]